jgi:Major Facilitator Superfamily
LVLRATSPSSSPDSSGDSSSDGGSGALYLSYFFVCREAAFLLFQPIAGVVGDRFHRDRRPLLMFADGCRAVIVLGFIIPALVAPEKTWPLLYLFTFFQFAFAALFAPNYSSILPQLVGSAKEVAPAVAISGMVYSGMLMAGAAAGGAVTYLLGPVASFAVDSLTYVISFLLFRRTMKYALRDEDEDNGDVVAESDEEQLVEPSPRVVSVAEEGVRLRVSSSSLGTDDVIELDSHDSSVVGEKSGSDSADWRKRRGILRSRASVESEPAVETETSDHFDLHQSRSVGHVELVDVPQDVESDSSGSEAQEEKGDGEERFGLLHKNVESHAAGPASGRSSLVGSVAVGLRSTTQGLSRAFMETFVEGLLFLKDEPYFLALVFAKATGSLLWAGTDIALFRWAAPHYSSSVDQQPLTLSVMYASSGLGISVVPLILLRFIPGAPRNSRWMIGAGASFLAVSYFWFFA